MSAPSPFMRDLARRLLAASSAAVAAEAGGAEPGPGQRVHAAVAVCETLRISVTKFAGADGFASLLRRALALARVEAPVLERVQLGKNGQMEGFEEMAQGEGGAKAAEALVAHVLTLLAMFIGESLTLRFVREGWPDAELSM